MTAHRSWARSPAGVIPALDWVRMDVDQLERALASDPGIYERSLAYWAWRPLLISARRLGDNDTPNANADRHGAQAVKQ